MWLLRICKRRTSLFPTAVLIIFMIGCSSKQDIHIGEWKWTDTNGETTSLVFDENGYVTMIVGNQFVGGPKYKVEEGEASIKYMFDYSQDPVWLDIIVYDANDKELRRIRTIIRFIGNNKMVWRANFLSSDRPKNFDPEDLNPEHMEYMMENMIVLTKIR